MAKLNWSGTLATLIVFALVPAPLFRNLGVPGYTSLVLPTVALGIATVLAVAQYVQLSLRERRGIDDAARLRAGSAPTSASDQEVWPR